MFTTTPELEILPKPDYWVIKQALTWCSPELSTTVPAGFVTDLASIPLLLRGILDVCGRSREPAILHDWLYCCQKTIRAFADDMLCRALVSYGEDPTTARVYWSGVRVGGWVPWGKRLRRGGGLHVDDFESPAAYLSAYSSIALKETTT